MVSVAFDHIAVLCSDLERGVEYVADQIGVRVPSGGKHPLMGTHNCLMRLSPTSFLEIIAPDPDASPQRTPWFGLSDPPSEPRLGCWVVGVQDIHSALSDLPGDFGQAVWVKRGALEWQISVPKDGSLPAQGQWPTLIQWPEGPHPASRMPDLGCRLVELVVSGPAEHFSAKHGIPPVKFESAPHPKLIAQIQTPTGLRTLS